jgi:hypothetical protein
MPNASRTPWVVRLTELASLIAALILGTAGSLAATPTQMAPGPSVTASTKPSPSAPASGPVRWQPVSGVLGNAIPGLEVNTTAPIVWKGRFYAVEADVVAAVPMPDRDENELVVWRQPATWRSTDGQRWTRRALPAGMTGRLSMVAWGERLAIIDVREGSQERGWWFLVWSSTDGVHWHRQGELRVTPTADLRGCGLNDGVVVGAESRLVAVASCKLLVGAGGEIAPDYQSIGSAVEEPMQDVPTYSWTSVDGRHWRRHTIYEARNPYTDGMRLIRSVGSGVAAVTCCRDPRLLWSSDGSRFRVIARLPNVHVDAGSDVGAIIDAHGTPVTWLLAARGKAATAVALGMDKHGWALWVLDPGRTWHAAALMGDVNWSTISTEGETAIVAATEFADADEETFHTLTLTSTDAADTWIASRDPSVIDYCQIRTAMSNGIVTMGCDENNGSGLWRTEMPPASTPVP